MDSFEVLLLKHTNYRPICGMVFNYLDKEPYISENRTQIWVCLPEMRSPILSNERWCCGGRVASLSSSKVINSIGSFTHVNCTFGRTPDVLQTNIALLRSQIEQALGATTEAGNITSFQREENWRRGQDYLYTESSSQGNYIRGQHRCVTSPDLEIEVLCEILFKLLDANPLFSFWVKKP